MSRRTARVLYMSWRDLAFLHWPVPFDALRPLVPAALELELFEGDAWVGVVPFEMRDVRLRGAPPIPTAHNFPELNVRTYVRHRDREGVYFFSLDAGSRLAVLGARAATGLRYRHAAMRIERSAGGGRVRYQSRRTDGGADARFEATYEPVGAPFTSEPGSFEFWCTERYSLFSEWLGGLLRLDITHPRWPLQAARVTINANTVAAASGIVLPALEPRVLFASRQDVVAHLPASVG